MSSSAIIGNSEFGKSCLGKAIAQRCLLERRRVLVFDIVGDSWPATLVVDNEEEFLRLYWGSYDIISIVDECGDVATLKHPLMLPVARRGRHQLGPQRFGNSNYFIAHRLTDLHPGIRTNCSELFLFNCRYDDACDFALQFGDPILKTASQLPPGQFFHGAPGQRISKWTIDFASKKVSRCYD